MHCTIDIIIPSFRAQKEHILPIFNLHIPEGVSADFYLVIDNPAIVPDAAITSAAGIHPNIHLLINPGNRGASETRNTGINSGHGEWVLFLDDDITLEPDLLDIYCKAIGQFPDEIGFIGLVTLPPATTAFTKAIVANGSAGIFSIAKSKAHFAWGATANMMVKRSAMGNTRFSAKYPKAGGGEDVDFFLKIRKANHFKDFKTLPAAEVWHPWWNNGKANLKRAFRYGQGTGWLIDQNPEYTRYDFLSTAETLIAALAALLICLLVKPGWAIPVALFTGGVLITEMIANFVNSLRKKKAISPAMLAYVILLKTYYDLGVFSVTLTTGFFKRIGKRFNDNGSLKKDHFIRFNRYKITKVILYTLMIVCLLYYYH